jgi:hypothetical protein
MAIAGLVSVGTTATLLATPAVPTYVASSQSSFCLQNVSDADVFLGGSGVTTSAYGHKLAAGESISLDLNYGDGIYAIVATGSKSVAVLEVGTR